MHNNYAIVGGGLAGILLALNLLRQTTAKVCLFDGSDEIDAASFGNAGTIGSHAIIPTAMPGVIKQLPKWLLNKQGPVNIGPCNWVQMAKWFVRWQHQSSWQNACANSQALFDLHHNVIADYRQLLGSKHAHLLVEAPFLTISANEDLFHDSLAGIRLRQQQGITTQAVDRTLLQDKLTGLHASYQSGLHISNTAFLNTPAAVLRLFKQQFLAEGGQWVCQNVRSLKNNVQDASVNGVITEDGTYYPCEQVVLAAGWASAHLCQSLGVSIPLVSETGHHIMLKGQLPHLSTVILDAHQKIMIVPMSDGIRVSGFAEFGAVNGLRRPERYRQLHRMFQNVFPNSQTVIDSVWSGSRPSTPDSLPLIGKLPKYANVYLLTGHGHYGVSGAPASAKLLTQLLLKQTTFVSPQVYAPTRFKGF